MSVLRKKEEARSPLQTLMQGLQLTASRRAASQTPNTALARLRSEANRILTLTPFPQRRWEGARHLPLRALRRRSPERLISKVPLDLSLLLRTLDDLPFAPTLVLAGDRALLPERCALPAGLKRRGLAEALATRPPDADFLPLPGQEEPFAALNAACFSSGQLLELSGQLGAEAPIVVVYLTPPGSLVMPRLRLELAAGAQASLVEIVIGGDTGSLALPHTELCLGAGASLSHLRLGIEDSAAASLASLEVNVAAQASYRSSVFSLGAWLSKLDLKVALGGAGAETTLDGLGIGRGDQLHDHHTRIDHLMPGANSHERYRSILEDKAVAVFDGTIAVHRDAQKSVGIQENNNLLLSDDCVAYTKPRLDIDADDVSCRHGATVGQLDPVQLHYLRTRGLDEEAARGMLVAAFARAMVDAVEGDALRGLVSRAVLSVMPGETDLEAWA